jgi:hypothetical protein
MPKLADSKLNWSIPISYHESQNSIFYAIITGQQVELAQISITASRSNVQLYNSAMM